MAPELLRLFTNVKRLTVLDRDRKVLATQMLRLRSSNRSGKRLAGVQSVGCRRYQVVVALVHEIQLAYLPVTWVHDPVCARFTPLSLGLCTCSASPMPYPSAQQRLPQVQYV